MASNSSGGMKYPPFPLRITIFDISLFTAKIITLFFFFLLEWKAERTRNSRLAVSHLILTFSFKLVLSFFAYTTLCLQLAPESFFPNESKPSNFFPIKPKTFFPSKLFAYESHTSPKTMFPSPSPSKMSSLLMHFNSNSTTPDGA